MAANRPTQTSSDPTAGLKLGEVRHKVTPEMTVETNALAKKVAPNYFVKDSEGQDVMIAPPSSEKPQFLYFVLDGCPCSYDAEPLFHDLYRNFKDKVDFVSVTDANKEKARAWSVQMLVPYPVIPDPEKTIIHGYEARSSVYSALILKGHILKMWPGYSESILKEQNELMAKLINEPAKPFDTKWAPKEKATGCSF